MEGVRLPLCFRDVEEVSDVEFEARRAGEYGGLFAYSRTGCERAYRARLLVCCVEVNILFPKNTNSLKM